MSVGVLPSIAIGPETEFPTWAWVGFNLCRELSKYYRINVFAWGEKPQGDIILAIKRPLQAPEDVASPVVYLPCDVYKTLNQVEEHAFLGKAKAVVSHSEPLAEVLRSFHSNVHVIEHDSKYVLPELAAYKKEGPIIWVGFSDYVPILREWLLEHPLQQKLIVLTDKPGAVALPGSCSQIAWTPKRQKEAFQQAKAALDIKGNDFHQSMKPPEKLQTFIASGIPSACNSNSTLADYFRRNGLDIAHPDDTERWFSHDYYTETLRFAAILRQRMSLQSVGLQMKTIIDTLL